MGFILARRSRYITNIAVDKDGPKIRRAKDVAVDLQKVGDAYVIIVAKGGAPTHPAGYLNLNVDVECDIQVGSLGFAVTAKGAADDERQALCGQLAKVYPSYYAYQGIAGDRVIPVVLLEPR